MSHVFVITLTARIGDGCSKDLRRAARERAFAEFPDAAEADRYLDSSHTSLAECAQMLLDPGSAPSPLSIDGSEAEDVSSRLGCNEEEE